MLYGDGKFVQRTNDIWDLLLMFGELVIFLEVLCLETMLALLCVLLQKISWLCGLGLVIWAAKIGPPSFIMSCMTWEVINGRFVEGHQVLNFASKFINNINMGQTIFICWYQNLAVSAIIKTCWLKLGHSISTFLVEIQKFWSISFQGHSTASKIATTDRNKPSTESIWRWIQSKNQKLSVSRWSKSSQNTKTIPGWKRMMICLPVSTNKWKTWVRASSTWMELWAQSTIFFTILVNLFKL